MNLRHSEQSFVGAYLRGAEMPVVVAERERSAGRQGYKATGILKRRLCKLDSATYSKHKPTSIHLQVVMRLAHARAQMPNNIIFGER